MAKLPEKIRKTLEKIVKEMRVKENIYGVALFGSWSRGDAVASSDVDLLILEKERLKHEFTRRTEIKGLFIDLNHIPRRWIHSSIPPEMDQRIYEMQVLYDRDWSLTNAKLLMSKLYCSRERVDIRTELHVIESDIYLSRATSAFSRGDFESSYLFATVALERISRVLLEVALEPFINSRFVEKLEISMAKLGMQDLFEEYLQLTGPHRTNDSTIKEKLKLFKVIWDEIYVAIRRNSEALKSVHFKVEADLKYYVNPVFLQGALMRTNSLIDSGKLVEAYRYLYSILLNLIENYVWLKSSVGRIKVDYTTLMRSYASLEKNSSRNYGHVVTFFDLGEVNESSAADKIKETRKIVLNIRRNRKAFIKNHLGE